MQKPSSSTDAAPQSRHELLILHTAEAKEWATYLQLILKSSHKFRKPSIMLYAVGPADQLHGYNFQYFHSCKCIVLLLTGAFMDVLSNEAELQGALQRLLNPPQRVVALLCGMSANDDLVQIFKDWPYWRKVYDDDEPSVYVDTILESMSEGRQAEHEANAAATEEMHAAATSSTANPVTDETEEVVSKQDKESVAEDHEAPHEVSSWSHLSCLTVQPNRVRCGEEERIYIIFTHKMDDQSVKEVEFSAENVSATRVLGTVENEYTISVTAPDMPAGEVALTMHTDRSCISLKSVTYYTNMGEVGRCLENVTDPINFICQAFNFSISNSNSRELLDNMLTDSLKSRMPATGLQLFGIRQIEEDNMAAYQRDEELPTLLHFAAKYGLKKLTTILLQSPGALQAYSVMNGNGDYPNTLAEKSGFSGLRHFMDEYVETADMLQSHFKDINTDESGQVYELMSSTSEDIMMKYAGCTEDIYESMLGINPDCAEDLYEVMNAVEGNQEEAMLRTFFQAKVCQSVVQDNGEQRQSQQKEKEDQGEQDQCEEEDPYILCPEDIYDIVDANSSHSPAVLYRPPAPIPTPQTELESETPVTYISTVFADKSTSQRESMDRGYAEVQPTMNSPAPPYDPYAGMKTPGQRQLISLQERVKVGEISVEEAVQEFRAWQADHERRASSIRYQQENLRRLRESITRRHKEKEKTEKNPEYEISAPLQRSSYWGSNMSFDKAVYELTPRVTAPTAPARIQRGSWKTGSTSSTSSVESNRLSTHSSVSCSSGTEPDLEEPLESFPPPPPPPRPSDDTSTVPAPRVPPRIPQRVPEKMLHERYVSYPTRALPERPARHANSAPPLPRRLR